MLSAEHTLHKYILLNIKMSSPRAKLIYGANTLDNVDMSAKSKNVFLISQQNICCWYSKEPSQKQCL